MSLDKIPQPIEFCNYKWASKLRSYTHVCSLFKGHLGKHICKYCEEEIDDIEPTWDKNG